ncbi:MAG: nucleotidyltransferase family protein [Pseudomonadota bacterium]
MNFETTAIILLASGLSRRFGSDKLMSVLKERPVLSHAAALLQHEISCARLAVVGHEQSDRQSILQAHGWKIVHNRAPELGQGQSLAVGVAAALKYNPERLLILLGDMPYVPNDHLFALKNKIDAGYEAAMTRAGAVSMPPALFTAHKGATLARLTGDRGAKSVFETIQKKTLVDLQDDLALDIDTPVDLERVEAVFHG